MVSTKATIPLLILVIILFFLSILSDDTIVNYLQDLRTPVLDVIFYSVTVFGDWKLILPLCAILLIVGYSFHNRKTALIGRNFLVIMSLLALITLLIKVLVGRGRPLSSGVSAVHSSFPSGHSTMAFGMATLLSFQYPRYSLYFYIVAGIIAVTRVYLGFHYLSDILAGIVIAVVVCSILNKKLPRQYRLPVLQK